MFRTHIKGSTPLGLEAKKYTDQGLLVPDDVTNQMVKDRLSQKDVEKGFIFDGYPRTPDQAIFLDNLLTVTNQKLDVVLNISSSDEVIVKRITGRRTYHRLIYVGYLMSVKLFLPVIPCQPQEGLQISSLFSLEQSLIRLLISLCFKLLCSVCSNPNYD